MNNIPYLASHMEKRAGKVESFDIIKRSINGEELKPHDWAVLYSYFMPPKPKKITNPFEWVSMACDQKESYSFCKYVQVKNDKIIAANTKAAHVLFDNLNMDVGWYDIQKGEAGNDVAIMPNVGQALIESTGNSFDFSLIDFNNGLFDIIEAPTGLSYLLPWNNKGVDKKYFDLMVKSLVDIRIEYSNDGPFKVSGIINKIKCCSVIMPFKIHGLVDKNEVEKDNIVKLEIPVDRIKTTEQGEKYAQLQFEDFA